MRILHVLAETGWSGGEEQLALVVRHLQANGHLNELALVPGARFGALAAELSLPLYDVDLRRPLRHRGMADLRIAFGASQPDLVHFGCGRSLLWGGLALRGTRDVAKVTTRRIDYAIGRWPWAGGRYRWLVDHVIGNCQAVVRRVVDARVPRERVSLVHEGIDPAPFRDVTARRAAARQRFAVSPDAMVVACAATLRPRKGQRTLVDAIAALADRFPNLVLLLAGGGTDLAELRAHAQVRGIATRVRLPGPVRPIQDVFAACDVFAMASWHEGLTNACLEAAAAGLPQVVSSAGGLPEIVADGESGFVVPPGDTAAFADRIARLLADERLRRAAGQAGRRRVEERFTAERMVRTTEELFEHLVARARSVAGAHATR